MRSILAGLGVLACVSAAQAYELKNLSAQDVLTIGRGLDELPRRETDANGLYQRIQQQLVEQDRAAASAASAAAEARIAAKLKAEAEKAKPETSKSEPPKTPASEGFAP